MPHPNIRSRQSDQPVYNTNFDRTGNPGWTRGNQFIVTSDIVSGQPGTRGQFIEETQPEVDASFTRYSIRDHHRARYH